MFKDGNIFVIRGKIRTFRGKSEQVSFLFVHKGSSFWTKVWVLG